MSAVPASLTGSIQASPALTLRDDQPSTRRPSAPTQPTPPSQAPTGFRALPATGVVLIGTPGGVRTMAAHLAGLSATGSLCIPVGCVLTTRLSTAADSPAAGGLLPPLLGFADELIDLHARFRFRLALVCLPRKDEPEQRRLAQLLKVLEVPARFVPTVEDLLTGEAVANAHARAPGAIDPAALIGRTHSGLDHKAVGAILAGKRVLITGAGGSIGSELCRVVAGFGPSELVLVERAENALFQIDHAIARHFPGVPRRAVLHDVVDAAGTARLLGQLKPHVVFHAAAHKHVPLMEDHPAHAVTNNLFGTKSIADAAHACGAERLVMISSDKAVNPTSVMGATKRMAEMYIQHLATVSRKTRYSLVRFGNVLASACSVIPIWSQQLADGHPLTVTDPRMTRYFMTIPEAATLVVQAGALDQPVGSAPVYVLDMGKPLRILDLAVRFVRLHGMEPRFTVNAANTADGANLANGKEEWVLPETDDAPDAATVEVQFTGARPGEKLYEELAYDAERLSRTAHPAIGQWSAEGATVEHHAVEAMMREMSTLRSEANPDKDRVVEAIRRHVPEMKRA